jgi:hypothetical protein
MAKKITGTSAGPPSVAREQGLVPISCPDCFGVLRVEREGHGGHLLYRCQVDHRYSLPSLLAAMETHLERSLWSAALLLKQMSIAYEDLLAEEAPSSTARRRDVQRRIDEVEEQCRALRTRIESSHAVE